jgi:hypothetical protein
MKIQVQYTLYIMIDGWPDFIDLSEAQAIVDSNRRDTLIIDAISCDAAMLISKRAIHGAITPDSDGVYRLHQVWSIDPNAVLATSVRSDHLYIVVDGTFGTISLERNLGPRQYKTARAEVLLQDNEESRELLMHPKLLNTLIHVASVWSNSTTDRYFRLGCDIDDTIHDIRYPPERDPIESIFSREP